MIQIQNLNKLHAPLHAAIFEKLGSLITSSQFIGGKEVENFEKSFAKMHSFNHAISCGNGTDALYIALKSLNLPSESDVLVTALTWISSSEIITQSGHKPVFVDVGDSGFNVDLTTIKKYITSNTRAIVLVHLYGTPCNMGEIVEYCNNHNIKIIEDCAQAHFATYRGQMVGTFGDVAAFSFYPGKNLGAFGDAGAICTNDSDIANFCRLYSKHGALKKHHHLIEGINSRMDSIQAAILNLKLDHIQSWTAKRRDVAKNYFCKIVNRHIKLPVFLENSEPVWHLFTVEVDDRDSFVRYLEDKKIGYATNYPIPVPFQPCYGGVNNSPEEFPNAAKKCAKLVNIPMCPSLCGEDVDYIIDVLNAYNI
tara:strand:- start:497 stop:1594 length:1098 start_codon:yes stop_codon:yes gene_type:complete